MILFINDEQSCAFAMNKKFKTWFLNLNWNVSSKINFKTSR